jgi:hypothetical protein
MYFSPIYYHNFFFSVAWKECFSTETLGIRTMYMYTQNKFVIF